MHALLRARSTASARQHRERQHDEDVEAEADGEFEHLVGVLEGREDDGGCGGVHQFVGGVLDAKIEAGCLSELLSLSCVPAEHEKHDSELPFVDLALFSTPGCAGHHVDR